MHRICHRSPPPGASIRGMLRDERGSTGVQTLIVIAILALGGIAGMRALSGQSSEVRRRVARAIATFEPQAASLSQSTPNHGVAEPGVEGDPRSGALPPTTATAASVEVVADNKASLPGRGDPPPAPNNDFPGKSQGTDGTYTVGAPTRPPVHYDNGFLQNPNDPKDPNPLPTREPTEEEKKAYDDKKRNVGLGKAAIKLHVPKRFVPEEYRRYLDTPDALDAYSNFLDGQGKDWNFSYDKFVEDDPAGQQILASSIGDTQTAAQQLYQQMLANDPSLAGKPVSFQLTGSAIPVGSNDPQFAGYPYPQTENWQKAIGAHNIWSSATVTVTPPKEPGGQPTLTMQYKLNGEDRYNFNPGAADIATGTPDSENGRFEQSGLGKQFMSYGTLERTVTWTEGDIPNSTDIEGGGR